MSNHNFFKGKNATAQEIGQKLGVAHPGGTRRGPSSSIASADQCERRLSSEEAAVAAQDDAAECTRLLVVALARWSQKRIPEADAALARLTEGFADTAAYQIADVYAYRGDKDRAFEWLERARRQRDGSLGFMRCDPFLANLHEDPRWDMFLRKMGLADDQLK